MSPAKIAILALHMPTEPEAPDVGAAVLLELREGLALDEGGGTEVIVVLEGVEPLPPMLVLLTVSEEGGSVVVVSAEGADDVAIRMDSVPALAITVPDAVEEVPEAAKLVADEAPAMADDVA